MLHTYGTAVVQEQTTPSRYREIAAYLRQEYEPGTGPGYLLAAASNTVALRRTTSRGSGRAVRAFVSSVRRLVPWRGAEGLVDLERDMGSAPATRGLEEGVRERPTHD